MKVIVLSVQSGPLEGGGSYHSVWVQPTEWEDRSAPHITRGPVPMKIDCSQKVVDALVNAPLPCAADLDVGVKVSSGNKSKGYVDGVRLMAAAPKPGVPG
jgi:hypothetical protein